MLELLKTEDINQSNVVEAVRLLNQVILNDHKSIQTLQQELAQRDEKLLEAVHEIKDEQQKMRQQQHKMWQEQQKMRQEQQNTRQDLQELKSVVKHGFTELNQKYDQSIDLLQQIAENTAKK